MPDWKMDMTIENQVIEIKFEPIDGYPYTHPKEYLNGKTYFQYSEESWERQNWHRIKKTWSGYVKKWPEKLIDAGFSPIVHISYGVRKKPEEPIYYNPNDNWLGVATYSPDQILVNGNKKIYISLQGMLTGWPRNDREETIMQNISAKYIAVFIDNKMIWETFEGENIPNEIMSIL